MLIQALFIVPALLGFYNGRASRAAAAVVAVLLLTLGFVGISPMQLTQYIVVFATLILLADPSGDTRLLSMVALVGTLPLEPDLILIGLTIVAVVALSLKRCQGRVGLYAMVALILFLPLRLLGEAYASAPMVLLLVGALPFQKWLTNLYSGFRSAGILVSLVSVILASENQAAYAPIAPILLVLGVATTIVGVLQAMSARQFAGLSSSIHQVAFGILLSSASTGQLGGLFGYLLIPCVLSLAVINMVHWGLPEKEEGMLEHGGLSTALRLTSVSLLTAYLVLFSLVSMGSEVFMQIGVGGSLTFIVLGCVMLFSAAVLLAASFRGYTLVFEGPQRNEPMPINSRGYPILALAIIGIVLATAPVLPLNAFALVTGVKAPAFDAFNPILLVLLAATALATLTSLWAKPARRKSWTMGYSPVGDVGASRGEVFTSWGEIFAPIYRLGIPDEGIVDALDKLNPVAIVIVVAVLAALGAVL